jgi:hypothetical protein
VGSIEGELILIGRNTKIRAIANRRINTSTKEPNFQNADWIFITFEKVQKSSLGGIGYSFP